MNYEYASYIKAGTKYAKRYDESSLVKVEVMGTKEIKSVKINTDEAISTDEIEMLEDMILVAVNSAFKEIDKMTEEKMGKFGNIPGLF